MIPPMTDWRIWTDEDTWELGWRAAGSIQRENEGPWWLRRLIVLSRFTPLVQWKQTARTIETTKEIP